jgi:AcrR family transcriptional regulator
MHAPQGRRERKRQQTADQLAEIAWQMFEEQGFEKVTMEAIATAADVAKGTLYNHFPIKEALLRHQFHRELQEKIPGILSELAQLPTCRERLQTFMRLNAAWTEPRRAYVGYYLKFRMNEGGQNREQRSGMDRIFAALIEPGLNSGEFRSDLPLEATVHYLSYLYLGAMMRWLQSPGQPLADEFDTMLDHFFNGWGRQP